MKAFEVREFGIDKLALTESERPSAAPGKVVVRMRSASLNFRDLMVVRGQYNPRMRFPVVPLSDGAGEIVEVGEGVTKWSVGDRVMPIFAQTWLDGPSTDENRRSALGAAPEWNGVLREYADFDESGLVRIPDEFSFDEAATFPCAGVTAWHALIASGKLAAGESVLTLGTGGVSIFAAQIALMSGAKVISTTSSSAKAEKLKQLGVAEIVNYKETPDWDKAVIAVNGGGVDHVVEVGGSGTVMRSVAAARTSGHVALIGAVAEAGKFDLIPIFMKSLRVQGIFTGPRTMLEAVTNAFAVNKVKPVIDRTFAFDDAIEAFRYMESGSHFGKVVINLGD